MKRFFRKLHRWLGLLMALQIIAWMVSGLYFSLVPIEEIRGEHLTRPPQEPGSGPLLSLPGPGNIERLLDQEFQQGWSLSALELVRLDGAAYWRVEGEGNGVAMTRLVAPDGSRFMPMLTAEEAATRAVNWLTQPGEPLAAEWVERVEAGSEIRGRSLPVWKVAFSNPESVNLYLNPWTGELLARRTDRWRIFDFLWMLHIMDFDERDDFNHPLLQVAAALGLIIALSGVIFWILTTRLFRRRKRLDLPATH